jgi:hypothetical protein
MHTCLAYAAVLKAERVVQVLLEAAKYDPYHKETSRQLSKGNSNLFFYEPVGCHVGYVYSGVLYTLIQQFLFSILLVYAVCSS